MDLLSLRTLITLIETESITATSEKLNRVPSAITMRIQQLEKSLGVSLFTRYKKRIIPTSKGLELYEYATEIIDLIDIAKIRIIEDKIGGKLYLGALESVAATKLSIALAKLYQIQPNIELNLTIGIRNELFSDLINDRYDAVIISDATENIELSFIQLYCEELIIIAPKGHRQITKPSDILNERIIVFKQGCSYRDRLLDWYDYFGEQPKEITEITSYHAILSSVVAGMGISIIPKSMLKNFIYVDLLSIHLINGVSKNVSIDLVWKTKSKTSNLCLLKDILQRNLL